MKAVVLTLVALLFSAITASAQVVDSWRLTICPPAVAGTACAGSPTATVGTFTLIAVTCNLPVQPTPTIPPPVNQNPVRVVWDDPAIVGRSCLWVPAAGSPPMNLAPGNYEATLIAVSGTTVSAESVRVPFTNVLVVVVSAPTGVRVLR